MIWGGAGENREKKKFGGPSPGRNKLQKAFPRKKIIFKRHSRGKNKFIFDFSSAPQIINGRPLIYRTTINDFGGIYMYTFIYMYLSLENV